MAAEETITYDVAPGYSVVIRRGRSYAGRRRWLMHGPPDALTGMRPIVSTGMLDVSRAQDWIALGFAPPTALQAMEANEKSGAFPPF